MAPTEQYGFFLPSVRLEHCLKRTTACNRLAARTMCTMCAHMEEPPRMIPGLHNAVSCPKSANCGWLSHPWPKCRFFHSHFMYLPLFILLERFSSRLVRSEGWNGSFWPEKVQCLTPPHLPPAIPPTPPPTMINVQIWKPPNATYFWLPMKTRIDHGSEKLFHRLQHQKELSGNFAFAFIYLWGKLGWLASSIQKLTLHICTIHIFPVRL